MVSLVQLLYVFHHFVPVLSILIPAVATGHQVRVEGSPVLDAQFGTEVEESLDAALVVVDRVGTIVPGAVRRLEMTVGCWKARWGKF